MLSSDLTGSLAILSKVEQLHHGLRFEVLHEDKIDVGKSRCRYSRSKRAVALSTLKPLRTKRYWEMCMLVWNTLEEGEE